MEEIVENASVEADDSTSFVEQELEALQSIYISEIEVKHDDDKSTSVSIDLHPATADNHDQQYVRMTLKLNLNEKYPQAIPEISIRNPRGLSEEKLNCIMQDLTAIAESKVGNSMLFEIIEAAKEHLTTDNRPCGECAICLYGFSDEDVFTKTECYHYFHSHCLARYVGSAAVSEISEDSSQDEVSTVKEILCPMCRLPIHFEDSKETYPPPFAGNDEFVFDEKHLEFQKRMADLYQKQVEKGGIIDVEAEKNKYLLEISNVPTRSSTVDKASPKSAAEDADTSAEVECVPETEENAVSQSPPKDKVSKNKEVNQNSSSESKHKDFQPRGGTKNYRNDYNRHPRGNAFRGNSYRGNQRYNRYPNAQRFEQNSRKGNFSHKKFDRDEHFESEDIEELCDDTSPMSEPTSGSRSLNISSYKRNERNYNAPRRYEDERHNRGNYSRFSHSGNNNRGRRYGPNAYDKPNYREHRRQNLDKNIPNEKTSPINDIATNSDVTVSDPVAPETSNEPLNEKNATTSASEECPERQCSENTDKVERSQKENFLESSSNKNSNVPSRRNAYRNNDSYSREENSQSQEKRDSYRRGKPDRGYRNQYNDRHSYRENYQFQGNKFSQENRRNFNRRSHNTYRHSNEESSSNIDKRRDYDNGFDGSSTNDRSQHAERNLETNDRNQHAERNLETKDRNQHAERNLETSGRNQRGNQNVESNDRSQHAERNFETNERNQHAEQNLEEQTSSNGKYESRPQRQNNYKENFLRKSSNRNSREDRGDSYHAEKSNGYNSRNRSNSHYQNRNYGTRGNYGNNRYGSERPSYQDGRDSNRYSMPRKYNSKYSDIRYQKDNEESTLEPQVSTNLKNNFNGMQISDSVSEKPAIPKAAVNNGFSSELPSKESKVPGDLKVSGLNSSASLDAQPQKKLPPPPGFSNPLKKVVYGLQAANPPPGFPRS